jgi:hypothetical protein
MGWRNTAARWFTAMKKPKCYDLLPGVLLPSFLGGASFDSLQTPLDLSAASGYGSSVFTSPRSIKWNCGESTSTEQNVGAGVVVAV